MYLAGVGRYHASRHNMVACFSSNSHLINQISSNTPSFLKIAIPQVFSDPEVSNFQIINHFIAVNIEESHQLQSPSTS